MTSMTATPESPLPIDRPLSRRTLSGRIIGWLRANLFASIPSSIISLLLIFVLGKALFSLVQWGYVNAIWMVSGDQTGPCRAIRGIGACWAVIPEKYRFILFGTYPFSEQWRPALATLIFIALFYLSTRRSMWGQKLILAWAGALVLIGVLMWGGVFGLSYVSQDRWGGLPVTLILATFGLALGFPLGILVALGRRSKLPAIRSLCVLYVELIRGVPLISLLFMASVMFPLFMPDGVNIDKLLRAQIAFILYAGAYLAEIFRAGFDAHVDDPLAECHVTEDGFAAMTRQMRRICSQVGAPLGCVLEGGYALDALARSVAATLEALTTPLDPAPGDDEIEVAQLAQIAQERLSPWWPGLVAG